MKKIIFLVSFTLIGCFPLFAQGFEGKIVYSMEVKGENAAMLGSMMPNKMEMHFLGKDIMVRTVGGMAAGAMGDIITMGAKGKTYMVVHKKKKVYDMTDNGEKELSADKLPVIKEMGQENVNGYFCTKYSVTFPKSNGNELFQYLWATKEIDVPKPDGKASRSQMFLDGVEGFPVRMDQYITLNQMGGMSINIESNLTEISKDKPDAALFVIPSKYKEEPFDESKLGGM
jgi:hypothetical protein